MRSTGLAIAFAAAAILAVTGVALPRAAVEPQLGWPVANGSGMEAGFNSPPNIADLDGDGDLEIVVGSRDAKVYAWHHDGSSVAGWPFTTGSYIYAGVAVGEIDGDGYPEVVFISNDGYLYAVSNDGLVLPGWPKLLEHSWPHSGGSIGQCPPTLVDLDGDGMQDVLFSSNKFFVTYAFDFQGRDIAGWPKALEEWEYSDVVAAGDLDDDGSPEVVVGVFGPCDHCNYNKIYAWHSDGSPVAGWPVLLEDYYWSPVWDIVLADVDNDGALDVVATDAMNVYVLDGDGTMHAGWPFEGARTDLDVHRIAIANLDADAELEIVADYLNELLVFDHDGTLLTTYPTSQNNPGHPAVADIDDDGVNEIITVDNFPNPSVYAWNEDGSPVAGFPLSTAGWVDGTPLVADLDGDGDLEIAVGDTGQHAAQLFFYVWDLGARRNPAMMEWPMFRHDPQNTGLYSKAARVRHSGPRRAPTGATFTLVDSSP